MTRSLTQLARKSLTSRQMDTEEMLGNPLFDPKVNPDAQEALSIKYSNAAVLVLPLSSGNLGIFDRSFTLRAIVPDPSQGQFALWSAAFRLDLSNRTAEARYYGEPDDQQYKSDRMAHAREAQREQRNNKPGVDISDFEF